MAIPYRYAELESPFTAPDLAWLLTAAGGGRQCAPSHTIWLLVTANFIGEAVTVFREVITAAIVVRVRSEGGRHD
jgi:hypothetical protein